MAAEALRRLPRTGEEKSAFLAGGYALAREMSWDVIATNYFLPAVHEICRRGEGADAA